MTQTWILALKRVSRSRRRDPNVWMNVHNIGFVEGDFLMSTIVNLNHHLLIKPPYIYIYEPRSK